MKPSSLLKSYGPGIAVAATGVGAGDLVAASVAGAKFGTVILWAVLEHFREPFRVLADLREVTRPGSVLIINTTNAASLSHQLLGPNWEGYFDWSHHGIDQITVSSLGEALTRLAE